MRISRDVPSHRFNVRHRQPIGLLGQQVSKWTLIPGQNLEMEFDFEGLHQALELVSARSPSRSRNSVDPAGLGALATILRMDPLFDGERKGAAAVSHVAARGAIKPNDSEEFCGAV
jgi:hypothetical protein